MISIVNCYAPTNSADEEEKDAFYHELEEVVKREKSYYKYLCGDFNAALGNGNDGNWRLGKHGEGNRNDNGTRVLDLVYSCNLYHGNSLFDKPQNRRWTWESPNGELHLELDHVFTNRRWSLMDVTVLPSFDCGSDHRLVRMNVRLNDRIFKRDTHRGPPIRFPRYNEEVLETAMNNQSWRLLEDVTKDYEMLNSNLLRCAEAATENQ
ncbi:hypothetical protein OSTOST_02967, partial [Ostertagia ostertagi]